MLYNLTSKAYELYEQLSDPEIELPEEQLQEIYKDTLEANGESYLIDRTVELIRTFEADAEVAKNEKDFFLQKAKDCRKCNQEIKSRTHVLFDYFKSEKSKDRKVFSNQISKSIGLYFR